MYCAKCGKQIPEGSKVCPECNAEQAQQEKKTKFCQHCGETIDADCVVCPKCGRQVSQLKSEQPQVVINNTNTSTNVNTNVNRNVNANVADYHGRRARSKWVALILCICLGYFGAHKFYEGKTGMGILYLFTGGLCFVGVIVDFIALISKPDPYYV